MLSEKGSGALRDMLHNIGLAEEFARGHTFESLNADTKTLYALVRTLEIISEASRRVPDAVKVRHHHIEWREMAAAGNFYRHNYEDVTAHRVWKTVRDHLPALRIVIEEGIGRSVNSSSSASKKIVHLVSADVAVAQHLSQQARSNLLASMHRSFRPSACRRT